jgi:hypothetical protein
MIRASLKTTNTALHPIFNILLYMSKYRSKLRC